MLLNSRPRANNKSESKERLDSPMFKAQIHDERVCMQLKIASFDPEFDQSDASQRMIKLQSENKAKPLRCSQVK